MPVSIAAMPSLCLRRAKFSQRAVDALYEQVCPRIAVRYEPAEQSYGQRGFAVDDPDGDMLVFGQALT